MEPTDEARRTGGMRICKSCGHVFFAHGPKGCNTCGCTDVRGALFDSTTTTEEIIRTIRGSPTLPPLAGLARRDRHLGGSLVPVESGIVP